MAKPRKADIRTAQTKALVMEEFLKLLERDGFGKVGVRDICDAAGISRGTFYLHYEDKYALLDEAIDNMLESSGEDAGQVGLSECQRISTDARYSALYGDEQASARLISRLIARNAPRTIPRLMRDCGLEEEEAQALFAYMLYGNVAVNRLLGWRADREWERAHGVIDRFIGGGMAALRHDQEID